MFVAGAGDDDAVEELALRSCCCLSSLLDSVLHGGHLMTTHSPTIRQDEKEVEEVGVVQGRVVTAAAAEALRRRRRSLPQIHTVIVHRTHYLLR
jgi:hypothetical protein